MIDLDYRLEPIAAAKANEVDMASAKSTALLTYLFPGDVIVVGSEADFSARWGWVQVLDFALSLKDIGDKLQPQHKERFEFTESTAALDFRLENDEVCISSTYAPGLLRVNVFKFREIVRAFARRVIHDLCERYPGLALNPEVKRHL
jgi:hypothetical protein